MTNENRLPRGVVLLRSEFWKKLSLKLIEVSVFNIYFSHSFHILFLIDQMKGFVSIFQHLGRCIRRIFTVFRPDLTTRDKQHVRLLNNLEVHKPCMRKTYSSVHLTEPLRRIIEPHCRIIEPLWRNVEPHCGIIEPLRRIIEPHCGIIEPLWRNVEPHCGIIEPLRRNIEPHCGIIEPVWRNIEHRIKENHDRLSHCRNVESVYGINKSFAENHNLTLQGESAWQTTVRKSFSDRETVDMKAVVNDYVSSSEIIIPGSCDELMLDVSNDRSSNQPSTAVYRLTVRKLCKQSKINRHRHSRNREPSRIPVKKVIQTMRKRKLRQKLKRILRKSTPASSKLFHLITNYKLWYIDYIHRNLDSFYTAYFRFQLSCACKNNSKNIKNKQYSVSDMKLLLSGDIEMNPGPVENVVSKSIVFSPQNNMLLATRLYRHGLRPLDVGGGGDCFFRAVAHQLYGDPKFHLNIRALAVQYLSDHPERFIESNSENSWLEYLANISQQGTWCDNLIIQALADKLNIRIHITESNPLFAEISVIEPVHFTTDIQTIHLGHIDELHYVSTVPFNFVPMSVINDTVLVMSETNSTLSVGTAVYSSIQFIPGHPYCFNRNGVEMTIIKCMYLPHITIIGIYRSPKVAITQFCIALRQVLSHTTTQYNVFIGDFNLNWLNETDRVPLYNLFITEHNYRQLVSLYTTDNKTAIDHIYTNLPESQVQLHLLETYFSDHKSICALINCFNTEI